ncbi:UNVERIFIED_CONTAM: hypothetical protein H355_014204 [Colinus virginianus]|nr:hypothetical protein H355_014204 [Colinus virginianus]
MCFECSRVYDVAVYRVGNYTVKEAVLTLEYQGTQIDVTMSHYWPVREARPCLEKLAGNTPLLTGQRVLDALFPTVQAKRMQVPL